MTDEVKSILRDIDKHFTSDLVYPEFVLGLVQSHEEFEDHLIEILNSIYPFVADDVISVETQARVERAIKFHDVIVERWGDYARSILSTNAAKPQKGKK